MQLVLIKTLFFLPLLMLTKTVLQVTLFQNELDCHDQELMS